ncbi:MAG TPA: DUF2987 domain-containing protein [Azospirillaceae bacterium]|nr:DUF2987 domain-containing protein [Azospirillaceae bacterium]
MGSKFVAASVVLAGLLASAAALAQGAVNHIPYNDLAEIQRKFAGTKAPHDRVALQTRAKPKDESRAPGSVTMVIRAKAGDIPVPVAEDGTFALPLDPALEAENPQVEVNVEKGGLGVQLILLANLPGQEFAYADLAAAFEQFDAVFDEHAGMASFLAPSAKRVSLRCGAGCTATLERAAGPETLTADADGMVFIPRDRKLAKENPAIRVSAPVTEALIRTK